MAFVLGADFGYSNWKAAFGESTDPEAKILCRPAQAAPVHKMPTGYADGTSRQDGEYQVIVNDTHWVAGFEPGRVAHSLRELHGNYPQTDVYSALFHATLVACGRDVIDVLVTGLPVHQFHDIERRESLIRRLTGSHRVAKSRSVTVKDVYVVPQPMGCYWDIYSETEESELFDESLIVALDPGYFSVDWVVFRGGDMLKESSDASLAATSVIIDRLNSSIADHLGEGPGRDKLETALQKERPDVLVHGRRIPLAPHIAKVSTIVASEALQELKTSLRFQEGIAVDFVLLAGGGASFYADAARNIFPKARVLVAKRPVTSNANGYWLMGKNLMDA